MTVRACLMNNRICQKALNAIPTIIVEPQTGALPISCNIPEIHPVFRGCAHETDWPDSAVLLVPLYNPLSSIIWIYSKYMDYIQ